MQERFETFTILIMKINRSIHRIKTKEMAGFNLKTPHVSCLYYLGKMQSLTAKELCDVCDENKAAISRSVKFLEEKGFIVCDSNAKKRYNANFSLTNKGKEVSKFLSDKIDDVLNLASDGLTDEERKIMYKSLAVISKNLQKISNAKGEK